MRLKKVVLLFPPCMVKTFGKNGGDGTSTEKTLAPPLGILYLASELIAAGYDVDTYDFNAEQYSRERLVKCLAGADLAGISVMSFNLKEACGIIADSNQLFPDLPVIAGGPDLILRPRYIEGTAAVVCHEAETIIVPLVRALIDGGALGDVPGIIYKNGDGEVCYGPPFNPVMNLDTIRFPRRALLRYHKGYSVIGRHRGSKVTTLITSRGCPKRCRFCAHGAVSYRCYRQRSAENVLAEIAAIVHDGFEVIGIVDDNFTADKKRALAILRGIKAMNTRLSIAVQGRVDAADEELFAAMREAGVKAITFGLESGNQDVLDYYEKGSSVEENAAAIRMADRAGLYTGGIFILGAPFEGREHFERTYRFAAHLPLDITTFWVLDYAFGSPLWEEARKKGIVRDGETIVPAGRERGTQQYPTEELVKLCERYFFRYYRRPSYWLRQLMKCLRVRDRYLVMVFFAGAKFLIVRKMVLMAERKPN
ncbi:MAG: radical SAM protein [Chitinispirillaceae bacterium]|nr:radical SAM protein [Chitinispirillaceae bacterium]